MPQFTSVQIFIITVIYTFVQIFIITVIYTFVQIFIIQAQYVGDCIMNRGNLQYYN